jgi:uncharacterized protein
VKIAITGATGFVGSRLVERLQAEGHQILVLTRQPERLAQVFPASQFPSVEGLAFNPKAPEDGQAKLIEKLSQCQGVVNLAGESLTGDRWTPQRKQEILDSRQLSTRKVVEAIAAANPHPQVLVSASAVGYYGTSETATFDETSPPGGDFLAQVCQAWEAEAQKVTAVGTRLVILRLGIVLGMGGAIAKMLPPFQLFAGGTIGSGRQWFSWIHREDLVNLILQSLTQPEMQGVYNATAPNPVTMAEFCQTMGKVLNRPSWLPVPEFALELLLGEAAKVVLEGQKVLPQQALDQGFEFKYPTADITLRDILAHQ